MKILILTNYDVGLYQFRSELIDRLSAFAEVELCLPYGKLVDKFAEKGYNFIDIKIDRRGINPLKDLSLLLKYIKLIKKQRPDLVITYTIKPNVYGGMACRLTRTKYCANITGLGTAFQKKGVLRTLTTMLCKTSLKKASTVFFENSANMDTFIKLGITKAAKAKLLNGAGVNLEKYPLTPYPPESAHTEFLFLGRIMREKGICELVQAVKRLRDDGEDCVINVLGPCEEEQMKKMLCENESCGVLKYHGYVSDVRPYIEKCHCFVLPSYHEGMANTNLECSAMGRPIITSNIPGCMEAVCDGVSGFTVTPGDADDIYKALKRFTALSYEQKCEMGKAARTHMENKFDKTAVINETLKGLGL